ncbi:hypothetical protein JD844_003406 [Phrynosoma platyrhinos]|uniref:Uncharacterized protein n=1 Tax=Phrynosoma platyrhinos TaxID=52577 RepID=A0ABQ7TD31_PHRPL|nr:hypothetical protein JD844_003406 [Phrynosoma platyrhinos]
MRAAKEAKPRGKETPLSSPPPGTKKRGKKYEPDTMVIMPAVPAESVAQYSLALPSVNKERMLDEMDMLRNITGHLNEIVSTMEGVYAKGEEPKEEGEEEEEEEPETSVRFVNNIVCHLNSCYRSTDNYKLSVI